MLDARYVYLHEALGMGAMWLNQNAKVEKVEKVEKEIATLAQTLPAESQSFHPEKAVSAHLAREALLKRIQANPRANQHQQPEKPRVFDDVPIASISFSGSLKKPVKLLVLSVSASMEDVLAKRLFSGQDGELLRNMLAAIHLSEDEVHCATWLGEEFIFQPKPDETHARAALPYVQSLYQAAGKPVVLLLGQFFQQDYMADLLNAIDENLCYFIIDHPQRILSNPALKRPAWTTLQAMQKRLTH